jgi:hypothetical protein
MLQRAGVSATRSVALDAALLPMTRRLEMGSLRSARYGNGSLNLLRLDVWISRDLSYATAHCSDRWRVRSAASSAFASRRNQSAPSTKNRGTRAATASGASTGRVEHVASPRRRRAPGERRSSGNVAVPEDALRRTQQSRSTLLNSADPFFSFGVLGATNNVRFFGRLPSRRAITSLDGQ